MSFTKYIEFLYEYLRPFYATANIAGGHDWLHVHDVERMGTPIRRYLAFNEEEFRVAAILHNSDRSEMLKKENEPFGGWEGHLRYLLGVEESPFSPEARERILFAVLNHSKFKLPEGAPNVAIALQDADKLVRFRPSNFVYAGAHFGSMGLPAFLSEKPFGFTSTREKDRSAAWLGFMANLEWVGMLSCDEARELIDADYFRLFLNFLRLFGREMAEHAGCENTSQDDMQKALGNYYGWASERILTQQPVAVHS